MLVRAQHTEPFSFGGRRARRRPVAALHRWTVLLRLDGWDPPDPVCVDRVGLYFRTLTHTVPHCTTVPTNDTLARLVSETFRCGPCTTSPTTMSLASRSAFLPPEVQPLFQKTGAEARIVFEVSLEGSARKLVTVRSALQLVNKLPHPVEVRMDHAPSTGNCLPIFY